MRKLILAGCLVAFCGWAQNPIKYVKERTEAAQEDYAFDIEPEEAAAQKPAKREARTYEDMKNASDDRMKNTSKSFGSKREDFTPRDTTGIDTYEANRRAEALERLQQRQAEEEAKATAFRQPASPADSSDRETSAPAIPREQRLQAVVEVYDKDGDGQLGEAEKEAVRQAIRRRFAGR